MVLEPVGFAFARKRAERMIRKKGRINRLLVLVGAKTLASKDGLKNTFTDLMDFTRLVTAWVTGRYTKVPVKTIVMAVAALIYFVNPLDVIPDFLILWGLIDDAIVLSFVAKSIKGDIAAFREWEYQEEHGHTRPTAVKVEPKTEEGDVG